MLPLVGIEPGPSNSKSNTILSTLTNTNYTNKTETLGSLYSHALLIPLSHALLIPLKSSKSKF